MNPGAAVLPGAGWEALPERLAGRTVLFVGEPGSGKSTAARYFLERLLRGGERGLALLSADPGQPSVGLPTCVGLAMRSPWREADALAFVGETSPGGHLLPLVVGVAHLAGRARRAGARTLFLDACGLVAGPAARALHWHTVLAAGVETVVAVAAAPPLEPLLRSLAPLAEVVRLPASPAARRRDPEERRRYRQGLFAGYFAAAREMTVAAPILGPDWGPADPEAPPAGTLLGLLDDRGACLGLGLHRGRTPGGAAVLTPLRHGPSVRAVRMSRLLLDAEGGFAEAGRAPRRVAR